MCLNHNKKGKVDQVFKPTLAYFFFKMIPGLQFFMFFSSLLFFTVKKAKQVSMKASEDNLKKVVDHGFKPVFGRSCV